MAETTLGHPCLALLPTIRELLSLNFCRWAEVRYADLDRGRQAQNAAVASHDCLSVGGVNAGSRTVLGGLGVASRRVGGVAVCRHLGGGEVIALVQVRQAGRSPQ